MIRTGWFAACVSFAFVASLDADPPVKQYFYIQMEPLQKAARDASETGAADFAKALEKAHKSTSYERRPFFRKEDSRFTQVEEYALFHGLQNFIKPMLMQGESEKVHGFLKGITDAQIIQGYQLARRGGSFHVVLRLTVDTKGIWGLSAQYRQFQILDGYEGPTIFSSLGVRNAGR